MFGSRAKIETNQLLALPGGFAALKAQNPFCYTNTLTTIHLDHPDTCTFRQILICPAKSQLSFLLCRRLIAVDRTFLMDFYQQTTLLAVTVDPNVQYLPLVWAVVESENQNACEYFFYHHKCAIPQTLCGCTVCN